MTVVSEYGHAEQLYQASIKKYDHWLLPSTNTKRKHIQATTRKHCHLFVFSILLLTTDLLLIHPLGWVPKTTNNNPWARFYLKFQLMTEREGCALWQQSLSASYTSRDSTKNGAAKISSRDLTDGWAEGEKKKKRNRHRLRWFIFSFFLPFLLKTRESNLPAWWKRL